MNLTTNIGISKFYCRFLIIFLVNLFFGWCVQVTAPLILADSFRACKPLRNAAIVKGRMVLVERGDCMFVDKARNLQAAGAAGGIVVGEWSDQVVLYYWEWLRTTERVDLSTAQRNSDSQTCVTMYS